MKSNVSERAGGHHEPAKRAGSVVATLAVLLGAAIGLINLAGVTVGYSMGTEAAWFNEDVERFGFIGAIVFAVLILGMTIALLATHVGARKPMTWTMGIIFALVCTQLSVISGALVADGLTVWLSGTPHREEAKFYSAGPTGGGARTAKCAQKISIQPALPRFKGRIPSFCAPELFVEPGLRKDERVVLVGRANWLGFVAERVERAP